MKNYSKFNNKKRVFPFRIVLLSLSFILLGFLVNVYLNNTSINLNHSYTSSLDEFCDKFNNCDFDEAEDIFNSSLSSQDNNEDNLINDLNLYFTGVVKKVCSYVKTEEISDSEALTVLKEIKKYNILSSSLDKLISSMESSPQYATTNNTDENTISTSGLVNDNKNNYTLGIASFNNKEYSKAISYFKSIPETSKSNYEEAQMYIVQCKKDYKSNLLLEADKLSSENYYTKAINMLLSYDKSILGTDDKDIINKIDSITLAKEEYLKEVNKNNN